MVESKRKGTLAELAVMRYAVDAGYRVALPLSEDTPWDLIVERLDRAEAPQRVQCKYVRSDGRVIQVRCRASNNWSEVRYTARVIDWIATFDATTDRCYFVPSALLGAEGRTMIHLRLEPTSNRQQSGIRWADDFVHW